MGYIAAALNKNGEDTSETLLQMLQAASPRPALSYGVADYRNTETNKAPEFTSHEYSILLGSKNIFPEKYPHEPLQQGEHSLVFNGILLDTDKPDSLAAADALKKNPEKGIRNLIKEHKGAYAVAAITGDSIIAGIDHIGTIPLYYGENKDHAALATNKKMLWSINIDPTPLRPGQIIKIKEKNITTEQVKTLENPNPTPTTTERLHERMIQITQEYAKKTPRATVAFSGGIDSLLTAYYLQQNNVRLELIWTGLEDQPEEVIAQEAADYLDIRLHIDTYDSKEVEDTLDNIITSIEEPAPVKTGIAYPFYWASKKTRELGYTTMYSGNGADELFAGYRRYLDKHLLGEDPTSDIYQDIANSYLQNFHRDTKTCLDQNIKLLLPFTHPHLIDYGLSIPINQKLPDNRTEPRKKILRKLALNQGIPEKLSNRPKKAAQYSSGVNKALSKIAKRQGMNLRELSMKKYQKIMKKFSRE